MSEQRHRVGLFDALKQILAAKGIRYRELAERLEVSEATIKRLFQEQDCKLSRLVEICEAVGVSFAELAELVANKPVQPTVLPVATEQALASDPALSAFFMLLVSGFTPEVIGQQNGIEDTDVYLYLRELEKLDLVRLSPGNKVHFMVKLPIRWRLDGPLHELLARVNQKFIKETLTNHQAQDFPFYSASRLFSEHSVKSLNEDLHALYQRFQQQASLDQMFYPVHSLRPFKLVVTLAPFALHDYFSVPAFAERRRAANCAKPP